jgi:cyclase
MKFNFLQKQTSRREMLRGSATLAGSAVLAHLFPARLLRASAAGYPQQAPSDVFAAMRDWFNAFPLETKRLSEDVTMLSGPGGSVVVLNGPDGKFVVDTFVAPAWPRLKKALDGLGNAPVKYVVDTHWHFDHTDNNAHLHAAGATVLAHENTKKRMSEPHDLPVLYRGPNGALVDVHVPPSPVEALPQQTFRASYKLNQENCGKELTPARKPTRNVAFNPDASTQSDPWCGSTLFRPCGRWLAIYRGRCKNY